MLRSRDHRSDTGRRATGGRKTRLRLAGALVLLAIVRAASGATGHPGDDALAERLRLRLETGIAGALAVDDQRLHTVEALRAVYERRAYRPAWLEGGRPTRAARELAVAIGEALAEGLDPADYHHAALSAGLAAARDAGLAAGAAIDLELVLSDAFLLYGSHLLAGHIDPETIDPEWHAARRQHDLTASFEQAIETGEVRATLRSLLPPQPGYARLKEALAAHRRLAEAGGWPAVPAGPKLEFGSSGERVIALRERLALTGEAPQPGGGERFDETLDAAVRRFQRRHGLEDDGVVGPATLDALNVSASARLRQIAVNLERWRWLPQELGRRHVLVNIAGFRLDYVEHGVGVLDMRVIAGKPYRRTPVFSDAISYLVLNPSWEVPPSLAVRDVVPQVRRDPGYLETMGMVVLQGWGADEHPVDPAGIDWAAVGPGRFPYRFRQAPGPRNALGRVKFMFPNRYHVYLHDTPSRELFVRTERAFSSGCIRVEQPVELALALLDAGDGRWSREALERRLATGAEQTVRLPERVPVHLLYWTAWVEEDGSLSLRRDVYGRDVRLEAAMREPPPPPPPQGGAS